MHRRPFALMIAGLIAAASSSCAGDPTGTPDPTPVATVTVSPTGATVAPGQTVALTATVKDADGKPLVGRQISWTSNAEGVATVSLSGTVQAHTVGTATITATSEGKKGTATITVTPVPVARVELSATTLALEWNGTHLLTATAFDDEGRVLEDRAVTWSTANAAVATVSAGLVEAQDEGTTHVWATIEGKEAHALVSVSPAPVARVVISPSSLGLESGEVAELTARLEDPRGRPLARPVAWASRTQAVAFVTASGEVYALQEGRATITATSEGVSDSVLVDVAPLPAYDLIYDRPLGSTGSEIFVLGLTSGAAPVRLNAGDVSRRPSPSPDGTRFAFAVSQIDPANGQWMHDLYVVNRNGLNIRRLTDWAGVETDPAWSPDGDRIAFTGLSLETGRSDVFVINVDGTGVANLTAAVNGIDHAVQPAWSPDGKRIAFVAIIGSGPTQARIWTMRSDGSDAAAVETDLPGYDGHPTWSPEGDRIAFQRYGAGAGGSSIAIVPVTGGPAVRLELPGQQFQPAWSPDGKFIAFVLRIDDSTARTELYTVRPDGSGLRLRTKDPSWGGGASPKWIHR